MADAPQKASARTTLKWGTIEVPVGLFKTTADPSKVAVFEQGGPNGGRLVTRVLSAPASKAPAENSQRTNPIADDPGPDPDRPLFDEGAVTTTKVEPGAITSESAPAVGVPVLVEKGTEQVVARDAIRKGVWVQTTDDDGEVIAERFEDCTDQLAHIEQLTALDRMDIQGAIDVGRVPRERVIGSYYMGTDGAGSLKVLELLSQAMIDTRRALVVKWTKTRRQATGVLVPSKRGGAWTIVLLQLCWPEDWRKAPTRAMLGTGDVEDRPSPGEFERAKELVQAMADSSLLLEEQRDDALALREELHALAVEGKVGKFEMPAPEPEPDPLMSLLEESLELARA